jgi:hypothetical protein
MADGVGVRTGTDATIHTDERTIAGTPGHIQRTDEIGATAFDTGQVNAISPSGSQIVGTRETRKSVTIINTGNVDIYIGPTGVTASTGVLLEPSAFVNIGTVAEVHGITASGNANVQYIEEYDL